MHRGSLGPITCARIGDHDRRSLVLPAPRDPVRVHLRPRVRRVDAPGRTVSREASCQGNSAAKLDSWPTGSQPASQAASRTTSAPRTFELPMSATRRRANVNSAAASTTASRPRTAWATAVESVMSPTTTSDTLTLSGASAISTRSASRTSSRTSWPARARPRPNGYQRIRCRPSPGRVPCVSLRVRRRCQNIAFAAGRSR